jgi:hypothetical protein
VWALSRLLSGEAFAALAGRRHDVDPQVAAEWSQGLERAA